MSEPHYWVAIEKEGRHLGAGFLVTRAFVLTARHCLRGMTSPDSPVSLLLPDGRRVPGRVSGTIEEADLALIEVDDAHRHELPTAAPTDRPRPRTPWRGTYSPPGENARLSGLVTHAGVDHPSGVPGGMFKAIQLAVDQLLGDYSGYSGSPVHTGDGSGPDGQSSRFVVGILMQQQLSRENGVSGTNVLFAASVRDALDRFSQFSVTHQEDIVTLPAPRAADSTASPEPPAPRRPDAHESAPDSADEVLGDVDKFLKSLREWETSGVITADDANRERRHALKRLRARFLGKAIKDE
ncbi:serine protease [Streptomyces sp. NBC_00827]|uniref:S1 family peptidase n=1 Tax=Streptomyces sp. NBC_00827 TaxID=2903677 RepID=UPI00386FA706|nr:serine protease [Streptomyces sp. NBC_00827]